MVSNELIMHNAELEMTPKFLDLSMKKKTRNLERLGSIIVRKNRTQIYWGKSRIDKKEEVMEKTKKNYKALEDTVPYMFREFLKGENEPQSGCTTDIKEINEKDKQTSQILVSSMNDNEWWTMVIRFNIIFQILSLSLI